MDEIAVGTFYSTYDVFFTVVIKHDIINDTVYYFTTNNDESCNMEFKLTSDFLLKVEKQEYRGVSIELLNFYTAKYKKDLRNSNLYDILIMNIDSVNFNDI